MRLGPPLAAHAILALVPAVAWADPPPPALPPSMRLEYHLSPGTRCPPDGALLLRYSVNNHVRHEPFDEQAPARMVTTFRQMGTGYIGHADLFDAGGAVLWSRTVVPLATCADAIETLAFAIAFRLEPPAAPPAPPPSPPPPVPSCGCCACAPAKVPVAKGAPGPTQAREAVKPPGPVQPPPDRRVRVGAGVALGFGVAPHPAAGLTLDLGVRWPFFSASIEGRAYLPTDIALEGSAPAFSTYRLTGALVPCGHWRAAFLCIPIAMGTQYIREEPRGKEISTLYSAVGGRLGAEVPLLPVAFLHFSIDVLDVRRWPAVRSNTASWTAPLVDVALNAGVLTYF